MDLYGNGILEELLFPQMQEACEALAMLRKDDVNYYIILWVFGETDMT
jgi:hypothetical protein